MRFERAKVEDAKTISELVNSAYRGDYSKQGWTTEADILDGTRVDADKICEMISETGAQIELGYDGDDLVGCVYLKRDDLAQSLYFGMLVTEPKLQGQGIGKKMLLHLEELAKKWKMQKICMEVIHVRDELIQYYERRGYQATGKWQEFPTGDSRFGIPKVEGLQLLAFEKKI